MSQEQGKNYPEFYARTSLSNIPEECYVVLQYEVQLLQLRALSPDGIIEIAKRVFEGDFSLMEAQYALLYTGAICTAKNSDLIPEEEKKTPYSYYQDLSIFRGVISHEEARRVESYLETYFSEPKHKDRLLSLLRDF